MVCLGFEPRMEGADESTELRRYPMIDEILCSKKRMTEARLGNNRRLRDRKVNGRAIERPT